MFFDETLRGPRLSANRRNRWEKGGSKNASSPPSDDSISCRKRANSRAYCGRASSCRAVMVLAARRRARRLPSAPPHRAAMVFGRCRRNCASRKSCSGCRPADVSDFPWNASCFWPCCIACFVPAAINVRLDVNQVTRSPHPSGESHQVYRAMAWLGITLPQTTARHALRSTLHQGRHRGGIVQEPAGFVQPSGPRILRHDVDLLRGRRRGRMGRYGRGKDHRQDYKRWWSARSSTAKAVRCTGLWPGDVADVKALIPVVDRSDDVFVSARSHRGRPGDDQPRDDCRVAGRQRQIHFILGVSAAEGEGDL